MVGRLTTHVLDTTAGKPAWQMCVELWSLGAEPRMLKTGHTNSDGRFDSPMLEGADFAMGQYELRFYAGDYLRAQGVTLPDPAFLDIIPIRFGIANPKEHYHVPLLLSPYGYSTYRGS